MTEPQDPRICAGNTRGKPFPAGNAGRPKGARNKATLALEVLLDGEAVGRGEGRSKKEAEQMAARAALERLD